MSDCVNLHTQLAYILDALANKALEEICKVVDDGYAVLRFEVSRHQKENEVLKRKLQMMALKSVQCSAERTATHTTANAVEVCHTLSGATVDECGFAAAERAFGRRERSQRRDGETTNLDDDEDDPETQDVVAKEEDGRPELLIIKEERREDDQGISEPLGVETVRGDKMDPEGLLGPFTEGQDRSGCDMNFSTSDSVQTHLGDIAGKKPIVCKYCGRGFARRNALEIHQRVHTGEKPFSCLQCGKQFAHSGNLKVHQSVHTGERRFRCALCGKRFISSSHLKRHWSVHTRERPFSCAQCGKRFSDAGSRKRHQSVHTGRTAFACAPCGRRFASSGHLRRHRLQVHVPDGAVEDPWPQGENEPL